MFAFESAIQFGHNKECQGRNMKINLKQTVHVLLAVSGMALLVGNAKASITMPEREHVQTIVWIMEAVTFATIMAAFWFIWRIGKKSQENRKSKQDNSLSN